MGIEPTWDGIRPTSVLKTVSVTRALAASVISVPLYLFVSVFVTINHLCPAGLKKRSGSFVISDDFILSVDSALSRAQPQIDRQCHVK